jgi:protein-tyrosine phosphatase
MDPPRGSSRMLTPAMVDQADEVYVMTRAHRRAVLALAPGAAAKVNMLDPEGDDVSDPIGAGQERYDQVAAEMKRMIERRLQEPGA